MLQVTQGMTEHPSSIATFDVTAVLSMRRITVDRTIWSTEEEEEQLMWLIINQSESIASPCVNYTYMYLLYSSKEVDMDWKG